MESRNINFNGHYGPGIVEQIITRGSWDDWLELRDAAIGDRIARNSIRRIVEHYANDPSERACAAWAGILDKIEKRFPLENIKRQELKYA